jgi:hypothetical protein
MSIRIVFIDYERTGETLLMHNLNPQMPLCVFMTELGNMSGILPTLLRFEYHGIIFSWNMCKNISLEQIKLQTNDWIKLLRPCNMSGLC